MTDRMALLEAVAEAARVLRTPCRTESEFNAREQALDAALAALSSLPAEPEPEGEMVEVRAAVQENDGGSFSINGIRWEDGTHGVHVSPLTVAIIKAYVRRRVVPEVVAEVVKP